MHRCRDFFFFGYTCIPPSTLLVSCFQGNSSFYQACIVVLCASLCNGIIFCILNSFGVLYVHLEKLYQEDSDSATKASLVGSVAVGTTFFLSPVSGILADKLGIRLTVLLGSVIASVGMFASSFLVNQGIHFTVSN